MQHESYPHNALRGLGLPRVEGRCGRTEVHFLEQNHPAWRSAVLMDLVVKTGTPWRNPAERKWLFAPNP